jgi:GT2 family glycosyltransferase
MQTPSDRASMTAKLKTRLILAKWRDAAIDAHNRGYSIVEIEVTQPLPTLRIGARGAAFVVRRRGRPIDFWMESFPLGAEVTAQDLARRIAVRSSHRLVKEALREELEPLQPAPAPAFTSLTIAICTKDRPERLERLLRSLQGLVVPEALALEIAVVDNAPSDDCTRRLVERFPAVRYLIEPRAGLDFARNCAVNHATGEILAFLDDDVVVDPGWLAGLIAAWRDNPDAGAVTGLVLPLELATEAQVLFEKRGGFRRGFDRLRYAGQTLPGNPLYPCGAGIFGAGANMAFRRQILVELGGFDEALDTGRPLPGGGDLDIFYRVVRAGYPLVYEPCALVFHEHRRDLAGLRRQYWSWGLGLMAFIAKSYQADPQARGKLRALVAWWFKDQLKGVAKSLLGRHPLPPAMVVAELWGGLQGLLGEYGRSQRRVAQIRRQLA